MKKIKKKYAKKQNNYASEKGLRVFKPKSQYMEKQVII